MSSGSLEVVRETDHFWRLTEMTATEQEALSAFALLFSANSDIRTIELGQFKSEVLDSLSFETAEGLKVLWREAVMQTPELWLKNRNHALYPHKQVLDAAGYHPARPKPLNGELYRRYIPELNAVLTLEGLDVDKHLTLFNKWQNTKRVANFWEQTGSLEEHKFYLEESLSLIHI